jgi:hypothetical protein
MLCYNQYFEENGEDGQTTKEKTRVSKVDAPPGVFIIYRITCIYVLD